MAVSARWARSADWFGVALTLTIVALYAIDLLKHGAAAAWHLIFLLMLSGPAAYDAFIGFNLSGMQREGEREYYVRYAHLSAEEADRRIAIARRFASNFMAAIVAFIECCFVLDLASFGRPLSPWLIFGVLGAFGVLFLAVLIFGVAYALLKLRHP